MSGPTPPLLEPLQPPHPVTGMRLRGTPVELRRGEGTCVLVPEEGRRVLGGVARGILDRGVVPEQVKPRETPPLFPLGPSLSP